MSSEEFTPLIPKRSEGCESSECDVLQGRSQHQVKISDLMTQLETSPDGLTTAQVNEKRVLSGLNYVSPPISLPSILCCFLICVTSSSSMQKYNECIADTALVKRNGHWIRIDSISLVPGDIVRLNVGERVPADIRVFKSERCIFDASSVMGRGVKVQIDLKRVTEHFLDSPNIAFMGYLCLEGECTGVVLNTGNESLIGNLIAQNKWPCE